MASESEGNEPSLLQRLISSRNRDLSLLLPIILGLTSTTSSTMNLRQETENPDQETRDERNSGSDSGGRIILINPLTQGMVVIEGSSSSLDSMIRDLLSKEGQPPASRVSIEAMPSVDISGQEEEEEAECVICLEEWQAGGVAKEMPCKHRFHGECIEKWLGIHGSCPVCRYKMPVDDEDVIGKNSGGGGESEDGDERERRRWRRREIWVSFSFNNRERSVGVEPIQTPASDSNDSLSTPPGPDHQMEG